MHSEVEEDPRDLCAAKSVSRWCGALERKQTPKEARCLPTCNENRVACIRAPPQTPITFFSRGIHSETFG
jgi:hypothetical protein